MEVGGQRLFASSSASERYQLFPGYKVVPGKIELMALKQL